MSPHPPGNESATRAGSLVRTGSWVLYDLANTVYAATVTFLFTPFYEASFRELTGLGVAQTASMIVAGVLVPVFGALIDRTRRTHVWLTIATLACVAAMAGFGLADERVGLLACFVVANATYNLGLLFYNSLLPSVASAARAGFVSGLGVGIGYFGTILVLLALLPLREPRLQFFAAAALFLVAALPCLALVRERRMPAPVVGSAVRAALGSLGRTLRELPRHRTLSCFLIANFCFVDVLNTAVLFFASFTNNVFMAAAHDGTLSLFGRVYAGDAGLQGFFGLCGLLLNALALVFGILLGAFTDRHPLGVMRLSACALLGALVGGSWFGGWSPLGYVLTLVLLGAFGLAGIWTAGRKVIVLLAPPDRIGEFFGLYGITVKLSVLGSTTYGLVADSFGTKPAMLAQAFPLLIGLCCLAMVRLPAPRAPATNA